MKRLIAMALLLAAPAAAQEKPEAPAPASLSIQAAGTDDQDAGKAASLTGPESRLQVVVTATLPGGRLVDWTGAAKYTAAPEGIVTIDETGLVTPLKEGTATVTAAAGAATASVPVKVEHYVDPPLVNFPNQVTPIFTKLGCNSGGCHGKSGGQNGFRLSLLGFEPGDDYEYLVKESLGRRLFPAAPEHSLLLMKGIASVPHGGGDKLKKDSHEYRLLVRWITQGMPYGKDDAAMVTGISVFPRHRVMAPDGRQQLMVIAHYSDGSAENVTRTARYEPNDKLMASVNESGRVQMLGTPGEVAVMIRYQDRVAVAEATVPLGAEVANLPPVKSIVDDHVFAKLKKLGLPPSPVADDATFLRRVSLDITGRLPAAEVARKFLEDPDPAKREKAIERLLESEAYADFFANKWSAILRNRRDKDTYASGNFAFYQWIRAALDQNQPYDKFVREIVTASGEISDHPAVAWYRQVSKDFEQVEDVAQLFLGVRIQCARCHHHPFEKWSRKDYYGMAAFFSRVGRKEGLSPDEQRVFHQRGIAGSKDPKTGAALKPTGLGDQPLDIPAEEDPRLDLANWLTKPTNPFFARTLVNRYWKHFFGRGIVDPEDDMRDTNPASNKELLDGLAKKFVESGYDLKELIRTICRSSTYQLSSLPNAQNASDRQSFSRYYPRRLNAEVLLDSIDQMNGSATTFTGMPAGSRAVQIPDHGGVNSYFLTVFGKPGGASACECERSVDASLAQSLHLLNSPDIHGKMSSGVAKELSGDMKRTDTEKVQELYFRAFGRPASEHEMKYAIAHLTKFEAKDRPAAYEDIVWALINTKEFLFNH
ncbi:MAG TPA: DUF1549 and DUF1553 domain-containing protein [Planctomycetota bacterium]|nr:DUF1549 and DUF1553 domain-containing protein [Planctomycetota bacterium]